MKWLHCVFKIHKKRFSLYTKIKKKFWPCFWCSLTHNSISVFTKIHQKSILCFKKSHCAHKWNKFPIQTIHGWNELCPLCVKKNRKHFVLYMYQNRNRKLCVFTYSHAWGNYGITWSRTDFCDISEITWIPMLDNANSVRNLLRYFQGFVH